ncbi:MAG TPA: hypothetical protein VFS40_07365 [Gemmatimonadales bacterium]|nr:hypothetical protein [Gemmatimonadales bacterium]
MTAPIIAAAAVHGEHDAVEAFRRAGATSPATARPLGALGLDDDSHALARLRRRAVIRPSGPGTWYLDEPSWEAIHRRRSRIGQAVAILLAAIMLIGGVVLISHAGIRPR